MDDGKELIRDWILPAALVAAGVIGAYWNVLNGMYDQWMANDDFSYGVLILPIALYLIWERRKALAAMTPQQDLRGILLMFGGIGLYIVGELGAELFTTRAAVIVLCIGAVWWLYGLRVLRQLDFPLAVLFLMLPLPGFIYRNLTFSLQILSSTVSVEILNAIGYLAYREGNVIDMGFGQFQVVDACNGLRFIMPMITLGILFAFFRPQTWWKRAVLIGVTIPLAMFSNVLRIVGTGILAKYFGIGAAQGFFHDFSGWAVFMVSFAFFGLIALALKRLPGESAIRPKPLDPGLAGGIDFRKRILSSAVALVICLVSPLAVNVLGSVDPVPLKKSLDQFPQNFCGRSGETQRMDAALWNHVGGQSYVMINYHKAGTTPINFYTAYYEHQRKAGDFIHSPKLCLPGAGWYIASNRVRRLEGRPDMGGSGRLHFNELLIEKGGQRELVYFWYQGRDRNFTNEYMAKFYMVWDGIWRRRTDGALVRLVMPLTSGQDVADARETLDHFALMASRELDHYLP